MVFYTKNGCPLCDEARDLLDYLRDEFSLTIREIDIATDITLYERYKNTVPVVVVDSKFTLEGRIEEDELRSYLNKAAR